MRRFLILLLALVLTGTVALANEITGTGTQQTDTIIKTEVLQSYTVIIPPELNIPFNQIDTPLTVAVTELHLRLPANAAQKNVLSVSIPSGSGALKNAENAAVTIPYTLEAADGTVNALTFDIVGSKDLNVRITEDAWNHAAAGAYADTVTFTISIATLDK